MVFYITLVHALGLYGFTFALQAKWQTLVGFFVWFWLSGLGITGGAHRLWAHRSYSASFPVRFFLMLCNSAANQGSIFHWSRDHRVHHKFSETPSDPHDATRGFFYAHVGWLLLKKSDQVKVAGKKLNLDDLLADPIVVWQDKLNPWIQLVFCFVVPTLSATYGWSEDWWTAFLILGTARYVAVLNATWLVNSVAHKYGYKPYDPNINPVENFWVALFALGEGWHNWHHKYPSDYATSEYGIWKRVNPTKLFIDICAFFGLVWGLQRSTETWALAKKRMAETAQSVSDASSHAPSMPPTQVL